MSLTPEDLRWLRTRANEGKHWVQIVPSQLGELLDHIDALEATKPKVINSLEECNALPAGTILDDAYAVYQKSTNGGWFRINEPGMHHCPAFMGATVLRHGK